MEILYDVVLKIQSAWQQLLLLVDFRIRCKCPNSPRIVRGSSLYERLTHMIDAGELNEAENDLLDVIDVNKKTDLEMALAIYDYMNDKEDSFLEQK